MTSISQVTLDGGSGSSFSSLIGLTNGTSIGASGPSGPAGSASTTLIEYTNITALFVGINLPKNLKKHLTQYEILNNSYDIVKYLDKTNGIVYTSKLDQMKSLNVKSTAIRFRFNNKSSGVDIKRGKAIVNWLLVNHEYPYLVSCNIWNEYIVK